jgi:hypothetical protein
VGEIRSAFSFIHLLGYHIMEQDEKQTKTLMENKIE